MGVPKYQEKLKKEHNAPPNFPQMPPHQQVDAYRDVIIKLLEDPKLTQKAAQIISEMLSKKL